jgi:hypothetical protein
LPELAGPASVVVPVLVVPVLVVPGVDGLVGVEAGGPVTVSNPVVVVLEGAPGVVIEVSGGSEPVVGGAGTVPGKTGTVPPGVVAVMVAPSPEPSSLDTA